MPDILLNTGNYKGKYLSEVIIENPKYLKFLYYHSGYDREIKDWIWAHMEEINKKLR